MKIFLSYRRDDGKHLAGRIADRLLGDEAIDDVFFDVETIRGGDDFIVAIDDALDRVDVFVVLIGEAWRGPRDDGTARLFDDDDFVRREVRRALERPDVRVIPVLHGGAAMPTRQDLPDDLAPLRRRNAVSIRHESFERDVDHLADTIAGRPGDRGRRREWTVDLGRRLLGLGAAAVLLLVVAIAHDAFTGVSLDQTLGTGLVWFVIVATLVAGAWFGPRIFRRRR